MLLVIGINQFYQLLAIETTLIVCSSYHDRSLEHLILVFPPISSGGDETQEKV